MEGTLAAVAEQFRARPRRGVSDEAKAAESHELAKCVAALGGSTTLAHITAGPDEGCKTRLTPCARARCPDRRRIRTAGRPCGRADGGGRGRLEGTRRTR